MHLLGVSNSAHSILIYNWRVEQWGIIRKNGLAVKDKIAVGDNVECFNSDFPAILGALFCGLVVCFYHSWSWATTSNEQREHFPWVQCSVSGETAGWGLTSAGIPGMIITGVCSQTPTLWHSVRNKLKVAPLLDFSQTSGSLIHRVTPAGLTMG